jgi:hypothetical protein
VVEGKAIRNDATCSAMPHFPSPLAGEGSSVFQRR